MAPMFHTLDVVYVRGGCIDLVGCPWWGKIEWLKNLSIFEGFLRRFKSFMVIVLDGAHVHMSYVVYVHGGGALTLSNVLGGGK